MRRRWLGKLLRRTVPVLLLAGALALAPAAPAQAGRARAVVAGGYFTLAGLQVPATVSEEERVLHLLEAHDVLVHPGFFFDFAREAYLVLSLLPPLDAFAEGLRRLRETI